MVRNHILGYREHERPASHQRLVLRRTHIWTSHGGLTYPTPHKPAASALCAQLSEVAADLHSDTLYAVASASFGKTTLCIAVTIAMPPPSFPGKLFETSLGVHSCVATVPKPRHGYPIHLSWCMVPASVRHTSFFGVRPRSGHLQAIGCTRWLLDGCFTTKARTCTCRSSLHSSFFGNVASSYDCCIVQLLSWLVICVPCVACDFVSRLGGWDTIFFQRTDD